MRLYGRIEKVETQDDGTVKVHGVASTETIDDQGEIVTADAMRAAIPDYLKYPALREMHQLQAAGKTLELDVGDDKVTRIVGHVVDPVAVKKIRADVYRGFSIGGKVTQRDPANHKTITGLRLDEISLVDRPANPGAVIEMWKAAIAAPMRDAAAGVWRCFDPDHAHRSVATAQSCMTKAAKAAEVMRMPDGLNTIPLQIWHCGNAEHRHLAKADAAKCMVDQTAAKAGGERAANADPDPARAALDAARRAIDGADAAIGKKSDDGDNKEPYGSVAYADPGYQSDGKKRYPIDTEAHIRAAWCVAADTVLVTNPAGPCEIADILEGAKVMAFHGQLEEQTKIGRNGQRYRYRRLIGGIEKAEVAALVASGNKPLFEVRTRTKRLKATADHQLLVLNGGDVKWKKVSELGAEDRCLTVRSLPTSEQAVEIDHDLMRLFGFFVGNGSIGWKQEKPYAVWLTCGKEDGGRRHAAKYAAIIRRLWPAAQPKCDEHEAYVQLRVCGLTIGEQFVQFGRGAHNKRVPEFVFKATRAAITAFLEGYIDADGYEDKCNTVVASCSKALLQQIKVLALMAGWRPANILSGNQISFGKETVCHRLALVRDASRYKGVGGSKDRSGERLLLGNDELMFEKVRSVTPLPSGPTFDVEIIGAHNFIADGFITHNSYINKPKNSGKYTSEQVSHIKSKIVAAWKSKIDKDGPPSADDSGKAAGVALTKTLYDAADLAEVIQRLRFIVQGLQMEAVMEGDDSEMPSKVQAVIDAACEALVALVAEETGEIKSGDEVPPEMVALAVRLGGADVLVKAITPADLAEADKARYDAFCAALAEAVGKAGAKHSAADQAMLDLGYHACIKCAGMDGLGKAAQDHMNDAAESFRAAGAGEIDDNPVAGETHETPTEESTADTGRNPTHAAPMQTPPAAEYHGQNSTVDTRDNARTQAPQVDPGGTGRGSNIDHIATALIIGNLAKRHGGHQMLMDVAHDCAMKLGGADAMCGAAKALTAEDLEKAGARHSAETMGHLKTAHDHIVAAGGACSKVDAHNATPGGDVTGEPEEEGQGTVTMPGGGKAAPIGDLAKVLEANGSLIKAVTDLAGRLDASAAEIGELRKRIEEVRAEPVPPSAAKRGLTLPEGIHRVEKTTPMTTVTEPPPDPATMTDEQLIALFQKMSAEEQGLLLTKAALRRPLHAQTGQPLG